MPEHISPGGPQQSPTPNPDHPRQRRQAIALGAGSMALVGLVAAGAHSLFSGSNDDRSQDPSNNKSSPTAPSPTPLNLSEPVLGSAAGAPSGALSQTPEGTPEASPSQTTPSPGNASRNSSDTSRRVLHDPSDADMPEADLAQLSTTPRSNERARASLAEIQPSDAFKATPPPTTIETASPLTPGLTLHTTPAWHLARRAGLGVTAADVAGIEAMGTDAWIEAQLDPESIDDSVTEDLIRQHFSWSSVTAAEVAQQTSETYKVGPQVTNALLLRYRFTRRLLAENVIEALSNHIYVTNQGKAPDFVGEYDRLIRTHALGRFADLLHGALTHPALLIELDNQVNTKDNPNENLGRELLELYTVGVGNYTEDDVRQSALLLTGHSVNWETFTYQYNPQHHHTGQVRVMDFTDANSDATEGPEVLHRYAEYLASHPGTAQRLARRFAVRFISDDPSQATVDALAQAYLDADTSIKALVKATLTHQEFWSSAGQKWRRPSELISSIARAAQVQSLTPKGRTEAGDLYNYGVYGWLISTGRDLPRGWPVVDGYPDTADYWSSASNTLQMLNATQDAVLGDKEESGETSWPTALGIAPGDNAMDTAQRITWHLTGYRWPDNLVAQVASLLLGGETATADSTLPEEELDKKVGHAVRVTFASPYASLR